MNMNQEPTREELKTTAFAVGQMLANVGDFYDVVAEIASGYVAGLGEDIPAESERHYKAVLAALNELASVSGHVLEGVVSDAREHRVPWSVIGDGLDVSKQAAQQRYGR